MELVDCFQFFSRTYEFDRLVDYRTDGKGRTTTGITVELGQYYTIEVQAFVKFFGCVYGILTGHGVYHEQDFVRINGFLDGGDFVHHLFVYCQTSGGIDDDEVISFGFGFLNSVLCDFHRILAIQFAVHRNFNLFCQYTQLFDSSRTVNVTSYE